MEEVRDVVNNPNRGWIDVLMVVVDMTKYVTSTLAAVFCMFVVFHGISFDFNVAEFGGPAPEFIVLFFSMVLLAANEGFQVAVLNSQSLMASFIREEGYHRAADVHELMFGTPENRVHGNLKRLLIGQSFMVVLCSFTIAQLTTFPDYPNVFGLNDKVFQVLFCSGLPGVVLTITIAQLTPSLLAKEYPLRFLNIPGIYHVILTALYLEKSGVLHFVYVLYGILNALFFRRKPDPTSDSNNPENFSVPSANILESTKPEEVNVTPDVNSVASSSEANSDNSSSVYLISNGSSGGELLKGQDVSNWRNENDRVSTAHSNFVSPMSKPETMSLFETSILYLKYTLSTTLMVLCFSFVFYCLATGHSLVNLSLPVQLLLMFLVMLIVTYCEGMKVSIVSTSHIDSEELKDHSRIAYKVHKLLNFDTVEGVKKFLLGRQLTVVPLGFFIASLTHFVGLKEESLPYGLYFIIVTAGLPGVMILLQVAQLTPQLLAEQNNIAFINLPGCYLLARWALLVESFGIVNVTWLFYFTIDKLFCGGAKRFQSESYDELGSSSSPLFSLCVDNSDASYDSKSDLQGDAKEEKDSSTSFGIEC